MTTNAQEKYNMVVQMNKFQVLFALMYARVDDRSIFSRSNREEGLESIDCIIAYTKCYSTSVSCQIVR